MEKDAKGAEIQKHVFTHYVSLTAIEKTISNLKKVVAIIDEDYHGTIIADDIEGGAKLATSSSPIQATFTSLNNIVECETLNGNIQLLLPENTGMKIDGISKRGKIFSDIEGLSIKEKPGNVQNITGILGEKPFQNVRISTINGDISLK